MVAVVKNYIYAYKPGTKLFQSYENGSIDDIIIREPAEYNNTKLIEFVADNKYKMNDPEELEKFLIESERSMGCYIHDRKPTRLVKPPPELYESIVNQRKQNTCPSEQIVTEMKAKESEENIRWFESLDKIKVSFKLAMDSMKFAFNFQKN